MKKWIWIAIFVIADIAFIATFLSEKEDVSLVVLGTWKYDSMAEITAQVNKDDTIVLNAAGSRHPKTIYYTLQTDSEPYHLILRETPDSDTFYSFPFMFNGDDCVTLQPPDIATEEVAIDTLGTTSPGQQFSPTKWRRIKQTP